MLSTASSPLWWRVAAAFALTPLIAAFALACFQPLYAGLPSMTERIWRSTLMFALFGGYPTTLVLGVPAFLIPRKRLRPSAVNCAATGALIAALPWLLLGMLSNPDNASIDGHVTIRDGVRTWWGWMELFAFTGQIAAFGALAGAVFWIIAAAGTSPRK